MPTVLIATAGIGQSPMQIVDEAIRLRDEAERNSDPYDQTWGVFDRDTWPIDNFNNALNKAGASGVEVAYSNEAFELWFLLHFEYCHTAISRADFASRLDVYLSGSYAKNCQTMHDQLRPYMAVAIRNAERLLQQYIPSNPATNNPSTTVHRLVQQLLRFAP